MFFGKKKNPHDVGCFLCHVIVTILLFVASLVALIEVIVSHYAVTARATTMVFGTNAGSLSIIAFAVTTTLWMKALKACMVGCEACGTVGKK